MAVDKRYSETAKRAGTYVFSTFCGMAVSVLLIVLSAYIMRGFDLEPYAAGFLALVSFGAGCLLSGFVCGRIKRSRGLKHGFRCAVIMLFIVMAGALFSGRLDGSAALAKILTAVVCGCMGGVIGVNRNER